MRSRLQIRKHLTPHMVEAMQMEMDGLRVDGVRNAPPFWNDAHVAGLRRAAPEAEGGAAAEGRSDHARIVLFG